MEPTRCKINEIRDFLSFDRSTISGKEVFLQTEKENNTFSKTITLLSLRPESKKRTTNFCGTALRILILIEQYII